jgi:hypothetical protein
VLPTDFGFTTSTPGREAAARIHKTATETTKSEEDLQMTNYMPLNDQDLAALAKLAEFEISDGGRIAGVTGEMTVEVVRAADEGGGRLRLRITFPNEEKFDVWLLRAKFLEQFGVGGDS